MSDGVYPISLGCPKAQNDLEVLLARLAAEGCRPVDDPDRADLIVINTCAFLDEARAEALEAIEWARSYRGASGGDVKIIVAGCLPSYLKKVDSQPLPGVDLVLLPEEMTGKDRLPPPLAGPAVPPSRRIRLTPDHRAYLKIAEGCDNRCSYCLVPVLRGGLSPREVGDIVFDAACLLKEGVRELTLVAQDVTAHPHLSDILRGIDALEGDFWLRLLYLHPAGITDELIDLFGRLDHFVPYFDIPVQHFSPAVLRAMNRRGWDSDPADSILTLADRFPDGGFRTSIITGFPGETWKDVDLLLKRLSSLPLDQVAVFPFASQAGTPASLLGEKNSPGEIAERVGEVQKVVEEISHSRAMSRIGAVTRVLVEGEEDGFVLSRGPFQAPEIDGVIVFETVLDSSPGQWRKVEITEAIDALTLEARVVEEK